nr:MAG TPA: hypothetical protein [Caudoviricetes sp.]
MYCYGIKRKYNKRKRGTYMPVHDDLGGANYLTKENYFR